MSAESEFQIPEDGARLTAQACRQPGPQDGDWKGAGSRVCMVPVPKSIRFDINSLASVCQYLSEQRAAAKQRLHSSITPTLTAPLVNGRDVCQH